ncbi:hypothetical protein [Hyphobacterium sp.]|uniref:hypothetical protein n=1 Tax=Hyphobacterium sp. TaxID=2004662 RepID=UPI003BA90C5F
MTIFGYEVFAIIGFMIAAYAIVANDAIQTLGTFLASNSKRSWVTLWCFACAIILAVMAYGWFAYDGDIAFDRLNQIPYPENGIQWWHALPPLALLVLTRFGVPVSTTFLVLTIFALTGGAATEGVMESMLIKSALGYLVAFGAGFLVWLIISRMFERWISKTTAADHGSGFWGIPAVVAVISVIIYLLVNGPVFPDIANANWIWVGATLAFSFAVAYLTRNLNTWVILQWVSTGFLWSQWLIQDLANIFVFLPRETVVDANGDIQVTFSLTMLIFATLLMIVLHAIIFRARGGEIQKIVLSKTNTTDIRAATIVDFIYAIVLMYFKELNDIPMSTTWAFLGLIAGRELAIAFVAALRDKIKALWDVATDAIRALIGLAVSVILAIALPAVAQGQVPGFMAGLLP